MRVDVVTAVHAQYARYLPAAWASLRAQSHPEWSWLVQIDGPDAAAVREVLAACGAAADRRVSVRAHGTPEGPGTARNIALGRSGAPLVQNLDADDELEPPALAVLVRALAADARLGFAVGRARDLTENGELREFTLPLPAGTLRRGALLAAWDRDPDGRLPVHPAGVMWRRALLVELGGWSALGYMEDTGTLIPASAWADGVLVGSPTLRYRKHAGQRSSTPDFDGGGVQKALIRERAALLAARPRW
ncbi:glycosyltransferase family 2 protein [Streptomyces polyrhachis]|uniref:Glycosyltransferase family 2 protein n=1 Tax=Streptomyces polyrhachis TaxID=1282885 RepID=A0ABW2GKA8_9ACTN